MTVALSCSNDDNSNPNDIEATGVLRTQGITTYQYGSHVLGEYALRSSSVNLDDFVDQTVTIVGEKIDGYPVDGGPDFLEVSEVR